MWLLYGRAGRLTAKNGGFRPGQYLLDCILEQKQARAIGSEALRAVVPFLWEAYGFRYAMQEWALYTSLFLTPLAVFCIRLCFAGARDDAHGDAIAISALAMAVVWVLRQLYGEVKQCAAAKHDGQGILATLSAYLGDVWNVVDVVLLSLFTLMAALFATVRAAQGRLSTVSVFL